MARTLFAYILTVEELYARARASGLPLATGGLSFAGAARNNTAFQMSLALFEQLKSLGPIRLMTARINYDAGFAFVPGRPDEELDSLPPSLKQLMLDLFGQEPRRLTMLPCIPRVYYTAPALDGNGEDHFILGSDIECS